MTGADDPSLASLRARVGDALVRLPSVLRECTSDVSGGAPAPWFTAEPNPYAVRDRLALTQTLGWVDAWTSAAGPWCVAARHVDDVVAAVDFARTYRRRLVIKGGGHSYLGTSSGDAQSLLVSTRPMDDVTLHEAFIPAGCAPQMPAQRAVSIGAGAIWAQAYDAVSTRGGAYVQGGGCLTVGVAGLVLSGGFGSFSKAYGTASSSLLEAQIVTADGQVRIANPCVEPDLFWALRGGGGGSFGVVTRLTLKLHALPSSIGAVNFTVRAASDDAYRRLIAQIVALCAQSLINPQWGEQIRFLQGNTLNVAMVFQGLSRREARAVWAPLFSWIGRQSGDLRIDFAPLRVVTTSPRHFFAPTWFKRSLGFMRRDARPGADPLNVFWPGDAHQAGQFMQAYESQWLPDTLLAPSRREALVTALFDASRHHRVALHLNKGLAGATAQTRDAARQTAINPAAIDAFALAISSAQQGPAYPGVAGHEPDVVMARRLRAAVDRAIAPLRQLAGASASYVSESNYFLSDWARAYWGDHAPRLARIKAAYDPHDLFSVHHGVRPA